MIDPTLEARERVLLEKLHPYGLSSRAMFTTKPKAKPGELDALIARGLAQRDKRWGYNLTNHGRAALGVTASTKET